MTAAAPPSLLPFGDFLRAARFPDVEEWAGPYPWQDEFARRWSDRDGDQPGWVVAPTGAGKTAIVDALVWSLAAQAHLPPAQRTATTRIVWAIDRRILVDEVYDHAHRLSDALDEALDDADHPLFGIAVRLLSLAVPGEEPATLDRTARAERGLTPLAVSRWRGGIAIEPELYSPWQPQVITSTVAQVGSRLLFRGHGVGEGSLAVAAGLAACDTTICLDEAHLAEPFRQTVAAIAARRDAESVPAPPLRLLTLTATPPAAVGDEPVLGVTPADHARLGRRWDGEKTLRLVEADGRPDAQLAAETEALLDADHRVVACVVNRVQTARQVHNRLSKRAGCDPLLLIGPQRPADRAGQLTDAVRAALYGIASPEQPLVVVATQTIEVGLDFDFDAMVTQTASASALVQRLGRLNRSGRRAGVGVAIRDTTMPLYEADEERAWTWLSGLAGAPDAVDVSVARLTEHPAPPDAVPADAATLTDAIVGQLVQTSPRPAPLAEPAITPLLSGIEARDAFDVAIAWRCDLRLDDRSRSGTAYRRALLTLAPPAPDELLTLSLPAARMLLAARLADQRPPGSVLDDADLDGGGRELDRSAAAAPDGALPFVVLRGRDMLEGHPGPGAGPGEPGGIDLRAIQPGDTIVVPTTIGGCDERGVDRGAARTADVGADLQTPDAEPRSVATSSPVRVSLEATAARVGAKTPNAVSGMWRRLALHLSDKRRETALSTTQVRELLAEAGRIGAGRAATAALETVEQIAGEATEADLQWQLRRVDRLAPSEFDPLADDDVREELKARLHDDETNAKLSDDDARAAALDRMAWVLRARPRVDDTFDRPDPPTLTAHTNGVVERTAAYTGPLAMPDSVRDALVLAALAHDLGKADPRFQAFLADGVDAGPPLLAKSVFGTGARQRARLAGERAGLPDRFRHEAASVAILADAIASDTVPKRLTDADTDLALLLTGMHHGRARPLGEPPRTTSVAPHPFPVEESGLSGSATGGESDGWLSGRWFQLFFDLNDRFGPWGLAYLQALLVTADRTVSREEK